ncbi:MAG: type II CRISPR-associated endonuclease Cas1 [Pseudomonadota bacterium]
MIKRIVEISSGPTRLSIANRQLVIEREDRDKATIPCEDVGVLLVHHPAVSYTHGVFTTLLDCGAAVVVCGADHHPAGLLLPVSANAVQSERYRAQIDASAPLRKRLWRSLVGAKLRQQAAVLDAATGAEAGIGAMAARVRSGDPDNLEAQAAQRYWPRLLGASFRRERGGPPPNNLLNYGYMALRAATARSLCTAGLLPTLGIHHHNRYNAFCLADDVMEPYRPFIDFKVHGLVRDGPASADIDRPAKQALLGAFNDIVKVGDQRTPLLLALYATASSLNEAFASGEPRLALPDGLPAGPPDDDAPAA